MHCSGNPIAQKDSRIQSRSSGSGAERLGRGAVYHQFDVDALVFELQQVDLFETSVEFELDVWSVLRADAE
jgi:hypothetical protein